MLGMMGQNPVIKIGLGCRGTGVYHGNAGNKTEMYPGWEKNGSSTNLIPHNAHQPLPRSR